jgi:biopolymer transport protein ExbB
VNPYPSSSPLVASLAAALLLWAGLSLLPAQDAAAPAPAAAPAAPAAAATPTATPTAAPDATAGATHDAYNKTLFQQIQDGGWVMFPIGLCSLFTVYLVVDGIMRTGSNRIAPDFHESRLKELFQSGDYVGAYQFCKSNPSPLNNVVRIGLSLLGEGKQVAEEGMLSELSKENSKLQTWISYLSVIGVCSPMIGLLGTVTGMIRAFATLGASGIGDPSSLSSAIGEVLVATASGLFIAIPAFMAFYFLRNRATSAMHHVQDVIASLFRKMPYETMAGVHIGDDIIYAATPSWLQTESAVPAAE